MFYPNEVEDVVSSHPDVVECAAIGMPDLKSGEAVKVFAVRSNPDLKDAELKDYCRERLTAYKVPRFIEFRMSCRKQMSVRFSVGNCGMQN